MLRSAEPEKSRRCSRISRNGRTQEKPAPLLAFGVRVVLVGVALSVLQQLMGLNAISYYGPQILQRMGYHMDAALLGVLVARSLNLLATMVVVLIVDRVGRKPLLIFGALIMGVSMMALGSLFETAEHRRLRPGGDVLLPGGARHVVRPHRVDHDVRDLSRAAIRGQAMSMAIAAQWGANFLVSVTFPLLFGMRAQRTSNGGFAFWIYGGFGLLAAFVVLRFVPETKGVDSERLAALWRRESQPSRRCRARNRDNSARAHRRVSGSQLGTALRPSRPCGGTPAPPRRARPVVPPVGCGCARACASVLASGGRPACWRMEFTRPSFSSG